LEEQLFSMKLIVLSYALVNTGLQKLYWNAVNGIKLPTCGQSVAL